MFPSVVVALNIAAAVSNITPTQLRAAVLLDNAVITLLRSSLSQSELSNL
jgi:hypothetical protein